MGVYEFKRACAAAIPAHYVVLFAAICSHGAMRTQSQLCYLWDSPAPFTSLAAQWRLETAPAPRRPRRALSWIPHGLRRTGKINGTVPHSV